MFQSIKKNFAFSFILGGQNNVEKTFHSLGKVWFIEFQMTFDIKLLV